ncbi:MAG: aldo/keto reductase [Chloroflexota bacterium]|nr:aldo/keto reductase [Chloroflexota bacterium]
MNLHTLGATNLLVSPIGLGLAALGRPGYINLGHAKDLEENYQVEAMERHTHEVLDAAWKEGVRYFDVARSYGRAEHFLSSWLKVRQIAPEDITVGSKWGYTYTAGWQVEAEEHEVKEHSLPVLQRQWQESWALLGNHLDLYQIHSATFKSGILDNQEVLEELAHLKERAGIRMGLSLSGVNQAAVLERAMTIAFDGHRLFDSVQATWNLLEPSVGPALQEAHEMGMGIIVKEALANGRLTQRNEDPDFADKLSLLQKQAARLDTTVDALALAAVLAQPWSDVVLSGVATAEHLRSNVKAVEVAWDEEANRALAPLAEIPESYWETRSNLEWR